MGNHLKLDVFIAELAGRDISMAERQTILAKIRYREKRINTLNDEIDQLYSALKKPNIRKGDD